MASLSSAFVKFVLLLACVHEFGHDTDIVSFRGSSALRTAVAILTAALPFTGFASSPVPPESVGIAAVDLSSGELLWEAWTPEQVPAAFRYRAKRAMGEWWDHFLPGSVEVDRRMTFESDHSAGHLVLKLKQGFLSSGEVHGVARFSDVRSTPHCQSQSHCFVVAQGVLHAMAKIKPEAGENWKPAWTFDLNPVDPEQHWNLKADHDFVWVSSIDRFLVIRESGEVVFDEAIDGGDPHPDWRKGTAAQIYITTHSGVVLARFPEKVLCFDRVSGEYRWSLPVKFDRPWPRGWFHLARDRGMIFFKSRNLRSPGAGDPNDFGVAAVDLKSGEIRWRAESGEEAPPEFQGFVSRESGPREFVTKYYGPGKRYGPGSFYRKPDTDLVFAVGNPKSRQVHLGRFSHAISPSLLSVEMLNHLVVLSEDNIIRCFPRNEPGGGRQWGPAWEFDLGHRGVAIQRKDDQVWVAGKGRLVCLDLEGTLVADFEAPENLAFHLGMISSHTVMRVDPDAVFLSCHETTAIDRKTGRRLFTYPNHISHKFELDVDREPGSDVVLIPTGNLPLPGFELLGDYRSPRRDIVGSVADPSSWFVCLAEAARAYGDRAIQMRLVNGRFPAGGLEPGAVEKIDVIARSEWPRFRSRDALEQFCLDKLEAAEPGNKLTGNGWYYYWAPLTLRPPSVSNPLADRPEIIDRLARACIRHLESRNAPEQALVANLFISLCLDSDRVDAEVIERTLVARGFRKKAAQWHTERGNYEAAARILLEFPDRAQRRLLSWELHPPERTIPPGPVETRLLVEQMADQPSHTSAILRRFFEAHPDWLPDSVLSMLRAHLKREAANPELPKRHPRGWMMSTRFDPSQLEMLDLAGDPGDTDLIRQFLDHPLHRESISSRTGPDGRTQQKFTIRDYHVRRKAAEILRKRGEAIPETAVFEEEFEVSE